MVENTRNKERQREINLLHGVSGIFFCFFYGCDRVDDAPCQER